MRLTLMLCLSVAAAAEPATPREQLLLDRIEALEKRLAALEARVGAPAPPPAQTQVAAPPAVETPKPEPPEFTTSVSLDVYFARNLNRPWTLTNQLRAFDVSASGFSVNQAGVVFERTVDPANGRRFGGRLDLMFGQAAETLMGNTGSEPRPNVFRNIWQAYGTYAAPIGSGLTIDAGKWASTLGAEGNYTKDQINYSRSYWFIYLPFYHTGARAAYPLGKGWSAQYWLVNGANQTENFNRALSQAAIVSFTPTSKFSWTGNYYTGQEAAPVNGVAPGGRIHILDSYATFQPNEKWTLMLEGDSVISRVTPDSPAQRVAGGAAWVRYRFNPRFALGSRFAVLNDRAGLFSGQRQTLKDATVTAAFDLAPGFQMKWEYRRDFSNRNYFETALPGALKKEQNTALVGLMWWFGGKQGAW